MDVRIGLIVFDLFVLLRVIPFADAIGFFIVKVFDIAQLFHLLRILFIIGLFELHIWLETAVIIKI